MAYLAKGRRQDLLELAETLDILIPDNFKVLGIKDAILKSEGYDVDFTKECLNRIISDRKELELRAERDRENQRIFELQKLLQLITDTSTTADSNMPKCFPDTHTKDPVKTWRDFYFDLQTYFDGWLKESKVTTLEELKDLIGADQIKKKTPQDYKDHFLDQWCNWNNPLQLVDKLDSYEEVKNMRNKNNKNFSWKQKEMNSSPWRSNYTQNPKLSYEHSLSGFPSQSRRETGIPSNSRRNPISKDRIPEKKIVDTKEDRTPVSCYGCGAPGIIRSRCHTCSPVRQKDDALSLSLNQSNFYSFSSESNPISIIQISICNTEAAVCADIGATHSVAGEKLYHLLKQKGLNFEEKTMQMTLADGRTQTTEILTTSVDIGIVLDLQRKQWYFTETSHRKYNFVKAHPNINALLTVDPEPHLCQLRKNEDTHLSLPQREEINSLLEKYEECFQPGGEPTPFIEHRINTRNHLPVAVPPYRMNPSKKEILKQEIDRLLSEGIIEKCARFKATNQKPAGLLRTPVYSQRFEVIAIDLYGPLPQTDTGKQWIFIVEDCATKWVELFALSQASARQCATTLIEVFMRHGIPRRIISDNGTQFVSAVLQQICFTLNISQNLIPVYSPQSNPVERKNGDLKPRLAILVGDDHSSWYSKLPVIRFAMNTTVCDTTDHTPAYLLFGGELRTVDDVVQDFKSVVHNDNFVAEITPYVKRFATITEDIRERIETKQDQRKKQYDKNRRPVYYSPGDKVWVTLHPISSAKNKKTSKFMPKRDGPYLILTQKSPTSYVIASLANPSEPIATYHTSTLTPVKDINTSPVAPLRKRGRPRKVTSTSQNKHVPSPSTATTAASNRTIHSSTRATTTTANYVYSPGRRRIHRGRLQTAKRVLLENPSFQINLENPFSLPTAINSQHFPLHNKQQLNKIRKLEGNLVDHCRKHEHHSNWSVTRVAEPGLTNTSTQGVQPRVTPSSTQNNIPKVPLPPPVMIFITKHYREQLKTLTMMNTGEFLKLYTNNHEEYHSLKETTKQLHYQFYVITAKNDRPIKVVIKGLPKSTHVDEIKSDLEEQGFEPERVVQLIGRKTKNPLPVYMISLPRNITNLKIFDIKTLGYLSIRVEPYEGRGITQCFTCNTLITSIIPPKTAT
ncbi:transposon Ty3-I Gag-Pol polyprotein [Trichonephila clavipes]|nr:transposon Ty3-I Gag-Pol polyprotein [Trichonephila clavipes]